MKLECLKEKLQTIIGLAEKITGKNLSLPILGAVVLEATKRSLIIRATNLELGLQIELPCRVSGVGVVAVPGGVLSNFLSSLIGPTVTIEATAGNLSIFSAKHTAVIKGYPVVDFPSLPKVEEGEQSFSVASGTLSSALRGVWYSASSTPIKPEISSVCFYGHQGELAVVATDSFRLAEKIFPATVKVEPNFPQLIVPIKNISEIIRVLDANPEEVVVEYDQHQISFRTSDCHLVSRLVEGGYPDYRQIIPTTKLTEIIIPRAGLLETLKLLNIFVDRFGQITLIASPEDKSLKFIATGDHGEETSTLQVETAGDPVTLVVNVKYLLDCLQSVTTDSLRFKLNGPHKPIMIQGVGDTSFTYLIMPINH